MPQMFDACFWKVNLRVGGILINIIHWGWLSFLVYFIHYVIVYNDEWYREYHLFWLIFTKYYWLAQAIVVYVFEMAGTFAICLVLLAGMVLKNRKCMIATCMCMGLIIAAEGIVVCYVHYFHQYVLTMRGVMIISLIIWIRVWFLFVIVSLTRFLEIESRVYHVNYMRDSFILPFRRDLADAAEEVVMRTQRL